MHENICCFIGHREINETDELKAKLYSTIEKLILEESIDTFLFGSKSRFNSLCYDLVSKIKEKFDEEMICMKNWVKYLVSTVVFGLIYIVVEYLFYKNIRRTYS